MSEVRNEFIERLAAERAGSSVDAKAEPTEELDDQSGDPEVAEEPIGDLDGTDNTEDTLDPDAEADDGDPADGEESEVSPEYMELEEKYKSLEAEFSRVTANRKEIEASLDRAKSESVQMRHQLEDKFKEAEDMAGYFAGMATQQLQQLQQVNPATLTQEQYTSYQQAFQQAQIQAAQYSNIIETIRSQRSEALEATKAREAEIARERLKTRIPDWSGDKYKALGEVAQEYGYTSEEFFDTTDYRLMLLLNEVQKSREAANAVEKRVKKTKQNPPKHRPARQQDRSAKGQYSSAARQFQESKPGTKGAFAAMKAAQLAAENKR